MNRLLSLLCFTLSLFFSLPSFSQETISREMDVLVGTGVDAFTRVGLPRNMQNLDRAVLPSATFEVTYTGFSAQAQTAFQYAVDIWSYQIASDVPIKIDANWVVLGGSTLGSAGANNAYRDFANAPVSGTWYPVALANKLAGTDLNPSSSDITANFNSSFANWYFGTDGITPAGKYDFVTVVLHEIGHGLGFAGTGSEDGAGTGTYGSSGYPYIYDRFVENGSGTAIISFTTPSTALGTELTSDNLFVDGPLVTATNGSPVKIYAPGTFDNGSSYSHWNESTFPAGNANSLMTPQLGTAEAIHDPGDLTRSFFQDMGWVTKSNEANAPFNLVATAVSDTRIDLAWHETSKTEAGYIIERATSYGGTYSPVDTILPNLTAFNDVSLTSNTEYFYQVRTLLSGGGSSSSPTPVDSATTMSCVSEIPMGVIWTGTNQNDPLGYGSTSSNSSVTITDLGENQFQVSDISGAFYPRYGAYSANQPVVIEDNCNVITILNSTGSEFTIVDGGGGTYNTGTQTLTIPWTDTGNGFSDVTVFTVNPGGGSAAPSVSDHNLVISNEQATSLQLDWTQGNGGGSLVLARESDMVLTSSFPSDSAAYSADTEYGSGAALGNSYVVYNGTGTSVMVTGLTASSNYYFTVLSYNTSGADYLYQTSNFGIAGGQTGTALPVAWLAFSGEYMQGAGVRLNWQVEGEEYSDKFAVEHSLDGDAFGIMGVIMVDKQKNPEGTYAFMDPQTQEGKHYYRIRQVDIDGEITYSPIIEVEIVNPLGFLAISPNPVLQGETLQVRWKQSAPGIASLVLVDLMGREVISETNLMKKGDQEWSISTKELISGTYLLKVISGDGFSTVRKVVVTR